MPASQASALVLEGLPGHKADGMDDFIVGGIFEVLLTTYKRRLLYSS